MTDEEKRAINRRLLEFCGWTDFTDHGPKTVHISRYAMKDAMGRRTNLPDLFGGAESAHLRERLMLKLMQKQGRFYFRMVQGKVRFTFAYNDIGKTYRAEADTYAEAFCLAAIQALEGKESE